MKKIQLWSVDRTEGKLSATAVESVDNTKTEQDLEELFVASPDLLMDGLTLIGRQVSTDGGPLDLLGIDADGRLVVFELKRGTLTRDAVAQVLDYASDLAALDAVRFGALIEKHSGGSGVDRIEDFADWYRQEHPGESEFPLDRPRMVLVGLGVDDRGRRVVNFLAESQVDIQLMTFYAFREDGKLFLARQIEGESPRPDPGVRATKESNLRSRGALYDEPSPEPPGHCPMRMSSRSSSPRWKVSRRGGPTGAPARWRSALASVPPPWAASGAPSGCSRMSWNPSRSPTPCTTPRRA